MMRHNKDTDDVHDLDSQGNTVDFAMINAKGRKLVMDLLDQNPLGYLVFGAAFH